MCADLNNPRTLTEYDILLPRTFADDIIIAIIFILSHMAKMA